MLNGRNNFAVFKMHVFQVMEFEEVITTIQELVLDMEREQQIISSI